MFTNVEKEGKMPAASRGNAACQGLKKGLYKKLLLATSGLSLASLAVFVYIAFTLFNK